MKRILVMLAVMVLSLPAVARAQGGVRQFSRSTTVGAGLSAQILIVGYDKDARDIERLLDIATAKAGEIASNLNPSNPSGDLGRILAGAGGGAVKVSQEVAFAFEEALQVARWTGGRFDIVLGGDGSYRDIKVHKGSDTVELTRTGMQIRFDPIISGFLAEIMLRTLVAAGMQNAIVKVGNVFRGTGQGLAGPWKIQVQDDEGTFAHHALNLTVMNTGIAAVSASQFRGAPPVDPRSKSAIAPPCRGVVALAGDAALAEGLAYATFISGPDEGGRILNKYGKGLIVDNNGKFIRSPGF